MARQQVSQSALSYSVLLVNDAQASGGVVLTDIFLESAFYMDLCKLAIGK